MGLLQDCGQWFGGWSQQCLRSLAGCLSPWDVPQALGLLGSQLSSPHLHHPVPHFPPLPSTPVQQPQHLLSPCSLRALTPFPSYSTSSLCSSPGRGILFSLSFPRCCRGAWAPCKVAPQADCVLQGLPVHQGMMQTLRLAPGWASYHLLPLSSLLLHPPPPASSVPLVAPRFIRVTFCSRTHQDPRAHCFHPSCFLSLDYLTPSPTPAW